MPKKYNEYNGFKVGDTVFASKLLDSDDIVFILDGKTYKPDMKNLGIGEIILICDLGYNFKDELGNLDYVVIIGEKEDD